MFAGDASNERAITTLTRSMFAGDASNERAMPSQLCHAPETASLTRRRTLVLPMRDP